MTTTTKPQTDREIYLQARVDAMQKRIEELEAEKQVFVIKVNKPEIVRTNAKDPIFDKPLKEISYE